MPLPVFTQTQLAAARNRRYRRSTALRCKTAEDIRGFVDDVGLCLLFPVQGVEMPNVYQAVAGSERDMSTSNRDPIIGLTWNTKDQALDKKWWYYGKLIRDKATLATFDTLSAFYALSENFGSPDDYLDEYAAGRMSHEAKSIYEALLEDGPTHAIALKRKVGLYGDAAKGRFDKAVNELQRGLKILPVGVAEAGAWRYAFVYELLWRWLPDVTEQARELSRPDARARILGRHLDNVRWTTPVEAGRLFGWRAQEVQTAVGVLVKDGRAAHGRCIKGIDDDVVVSLAG